MAELKLDEVVGALHPLEIRFLAALDGHSTGVEMQVAEAAGLDAAQFRRAAEWLLTKELIVLEQESTEEVVKVTDLGRKYLDGGVPEDRITAALKEKGEIHMSAFKEMDGLSAEETFPVIKTLKEKGVMFVDKGVARLKPEADLSLLGETSRILVRACGEERVIMSVLSAHQQELVKAGIHKRFRAKGVFWIEKEVTRAFSVTGVGKEAANEVKRRGLTGDELSKLTPKMLEDGTWRGKPFRRYNIGIAPPRKVAAKKHAYAQFLDYVKCKLITMGFEEMRGPLVESEFWNMDALFMPQFHSARDIHDAYFLKEPSHTKDLDDELVGNVARMHEAGGDTSSRGWRYRFDDTRTRRSVLRSQGTSISARTLASNPKVPGKYFAMARCFRYDTVDATHACDFMQTEGIVLGSDLNFRTLLGLLKLFAGEIAKADEVVFAPGYFPFTEPSVEAHIRHPSLGWIEMGGAGIFRPEVTSPFGIDVPVLAWGLGLDRMAMTALRIKDIRDLFSRDLDLIRSQRIDMEMD